MTPDEWTAFLDNDVPPDSRADVASLGGFVVTLADLQAKVVRVEKGRVFDDVDPNGPPVPEDVKRARERRDTYYQQALDSLRHRRVPVDRFTVVALALRLAVGMETAKQ